MYQFNTTVIQNGDFILEKEENSGGILINESTGMIHILNKPALMIYEKCDGTYLEAIRNNYVEEILYMYKDVARAVVERDFDEIINDMIEKDVVRINE